MKRICILAEDKDVETIRETAKEAGLMHPSLLSIPVSPNGSDPVTHWFCQFLVSEPMMEALFSLRKLSIMEENENSAGFLKSKNLKIVRRR